MSNSSTTVNYQATSLIVLHHSSGVKSPYETNKYYIAAFYNMGTSEKDV